jgi:hypothetical protein
MHFSACFSRVLVLPLVLASLVAQARPLALVSTEEMQASAAVGPGFEPKSAPVKDAPQIAVLAPDVNNPVSSPTPIEVKFSAVDGAKIRTDSLKVQYGALKIDVTKRILGAANVTTEGVSVKQAALPKGKHTLYVTIEDDGGRQTTERIDFAVN